MGMSVAGDVAGSVLAAGGGVAPVATDMDTDS